MQRLEQIEKSSAVDLRPFFQVSLIQKNMKSLYRLQQAPIYNVTTTINWSVKVMRLRQFLVMIVSLIRRLYLLEHRSYQQLIVELAPKLIAAQDKVSSRSDVLFAIDRHSLLVKVYVNGLAGEREVHRRSVGRFRKLPLGCRIGKLHFHPLLQLSKLADSSLTKGVEFNGLPRTKDEIYQHLVERIALGASDEEPPCFRALFGFDFLAYANALAKLRGNHPVLFVMLLANELGFAKDWARQNCPEHLVWVTWAARMAELERLVEIVSFLKTHRHNLADIVNALKILSKGSSSRRYRANLKAFKRVRPYLEQLGYSTEGLRALFLGDAAGEPLATRVDWACISRELLLKAAARSACFAKPGFVAVPGFRQRSMRFVRSRRNSAYSYYGVSLDALLVVGIRDLSRNCGRYGGIHSVSELASAIHQGVFGKRINQQRLAHQAVVYEEIYLREGGEWCKTDGLRAPGHGGSGGRFDPRSWFDNANDDAFYARLWRRFIADSKFVSGSPARRRIKSFTGVLRQLLPFELQRLDVNPVIAVRAVRQLACGLTPLSMDPIFTALVERALSERQVLPKFRTDPSKHACVTQVRLQRYLASFMNANMRAAYARFEGLDGRLNYVPGSVFAPQLGITKTLPRPLRSGSL